MKIGILTFHFGYNYGGLLQCLALQQVLARLGHDVEVINYHPSPEPPFAFLRGWGLRSGRLAQRALLRFRSGRMKGRCRRFKERYLRLSRRCDTLGELAIVAQRYDAVVVGSDQVWNRLYHDGPAYFLGWEPEYRGKRISYAASCGTADQPAAGREEVGRWLGCFDALSVRDRVTFDMAQACCGRGGEIVADPTLLYDFSALKLPRSPAQGRYLFMYTLGEEIEGGHRAALAEIRRRHGNLPVVQAIPTAHKEWAYRGAEQKIYDAGPEQWLALLSGAAFVYTDSFHAALFSLKQRKPFLAYYSEEIRSARLQDLAERYQLHCSVAKGVSDAQQRGCLDLDPDYAAVEELVARHVRSSLDYLAGALANGVTCSSP